MSGKPIAAPSANRFMHVSPTRPSHVFYDLYDKDVSILEGEQTDLGVESTVVRIFVNGEGQVEAKILRPGTLEMKEIKKALLENEEYKNTKLSLKQKKESVEEDKESVAPG